MLNISPFTYGMVVQQVYDSGNVFAPSILDIEESTLLSHFTAAIRNVACVSLAANYPTIVSVTHSLVNSYKNLLAISVETEYDFEGSEKVIALPLAIVSCAYDVLQIKAYLADPSAFAVAAPVAAEASDKPAETEAAAAAEEEEESDEDMGLDLFGQSSSDYERNDPNPWLTLQNVGQGLQFISPLTLELTKLNAFLLI